MNFFGIGETSKFRIPITSIEEQTKIATFLTTVDEKLQALKQKKTLLNQYKKGVMNKIFSQEIRFKDDDGNNYQDWEKKKLGAVANKKSSNISANKIEDNFGDYIIYGASGILKKVDFYKEEDDYISIIKDGAGVGRLLYCKGQSSVLGTMEIIRPNEQIDTYYLFCLLSNIDFVKYVTGSTIPHIYFKDYSSEICGIPCLEEQTKIANFLSAIDEKIKYCQEQIVNTEVWKKGLLQQMFC
jgi:type I restriction enzyme S subunit